MKHTVQQGESISSIAALYGHFDGAIWNHAANAQLKAERPNPNVLFPGDVVTIPDLVNGQASCSTGQRHRFRRKGIPCVLRLQLYQGEVPRAQQSYVLMVEGKPLKGRTDADGMLTEYVAPHVREATLTIGPDQQVFHLHIGQLDPQSETAGIQKRLNNLGFDAGEPDGQLSEATRAALSAFQMRFGLPPTGECDQATVDALTSIHDHKARYPEDRAF